ncbi:MAG: hypothetical protein ACK5IM_05830 [Demequina sp.]|uniref:hypothetical protein n=1 Tax=Demequina sp. TaxID=2050685 RepID=UPI003A85CB51
MSEDLGRGISAWIAQEAQHFDGTRLAQDRGIAVSAVGRARRRRHAGIAATSVASVAVVAATVMTPLLAGPTPLPVAPATTSPSASPSPAASAPTATSPEPSATPDHTPSAATTTATPLLDAASLLTGALPRTQDDPVERDDAQAALACTWDEGDDPRSLPSGGVVVDECPAVWVSDSPLIFVETYLSRDEEGPAIVVSWDIMNLTDEPLVIDDESVAVLLEVPPGQRGPTDPEVAGLTLAADDLWFAATDRATVQSSDARDYTLAPGASLQGETRLTEFVGANMGTSSLTRALAGDPFTVALQIRMPGAGEGRDLILEDLDPATYTLTP